MHNSFSRLLFAVYILLLTGVFLMTGDKILGLLIFVTVAVHVSGLYALRHPNSLFAWIVFRQRFGPETQTRYMTRQDLLRSGCQFLMLSLYPLLTVVGLRAFAARLEIMMSVEIFSAVYFASSLFFLMCVIGGIYLLIRGLLRSADFVPPAPGREAGGDSGRN